MSQHRKHRGYKTQSLVAEFLKANGFPFAESAGAGRPGSDVTGVPFDVEVKARRGFHPKAALEQLASRADDRLGFAVLRLDGQGEKSVGEFVAVLRLKDLVKLLSKNG